MKHYLKIIFTIVLCWGLLFLISASAMAASAEITLDSDQIGVGEAVQMNVNIHGAASERPRINAMSGLSIQYTGTSNQIQIINGSFSSQLSYTYSVAGLKPGRYTLGPFEIEAGHKKLHTNSVVLTVTGSAASSGNSAPINGASENQDLNGTSRLSLTLSLPKTTIYQGEVVPVTIKLLAGGVSINEVSYPDLSQGDFVFGNMAKPLQNQEIIDGQPFKTLTFHTTLTPVKTGLLSLGPVTLNCNIIVKSKDSDGFFDDFFPSYEKQSVQVKSKKISLNILPIPTANRPANFSGGIGQFQLKVSATPLTVNQGDPITVKMDLSGKGNLQAINAPILQNSSGLKVYDPQRKSSSVQNGDGGDISFEQVLIPVDDKIKRIGPFVFSYFNPATGSYQQIAAPSIPVSVKTNPEFNESSVGDNGNQNEHLGRDLVFIKDSPGQLRLTKNRLYDQPWFWILQLLPLLGLLAAFYYNRHQKMLQSNSPAARSIRAGRVAQKQLEKSNQALADGKLDELLDELHSIIRTYLAEKYNLTVAGMTGDVVDILREHGITEPTLEKIKAFFTKYDFYRFTGATMTKDAATALWNDVNWIIEDLNHSSANVPKTETKPSPSEWKGVGH